MTKFFVVCLCADELLIGAAQLPFLDILERTATNSTGETEDFWATAPPPPPPPPPPPAPVGDRTLRFFRLFEENFCRTRGFWLFAHGWIFPSTTW